MPSDNGDDADPPMNGETLWNEYVRDIKPLNKKKIRGNTSSTNTDQKQAGSKKASREKVTQIPDILFGGELKPLETFESSSSSHQIDRATAEKLRKGQIPIDARIDLHGLYQIQARDALLAFIESAYHQNLRCLLVITGKGKLILEDQKYADENAPGVIKRNFKNWLAQEPYASMVLKIQGAQIKDGGAGAYYILLRKKR
jgi:DNA-nicking Smr family endonuclease